MRILTLYQMLKPQINLYEANLKNLYTKSISETPRMAARGKQMTGDVRYFGLSKDGTINFKVKSQTRGGRYHYVAIDCPDIIRFGEVVENGDHFNVSDLMKLLTMKGFRIHCHCEAFLYYAFQYMATQGDYEIQPETRAPKRNNTTLSGGLCFTGDTLVLTKDGFKEIKDIQIGDMVYSHKGRLCRVTDTGNRVAKTRKLKIGTKWVETTDEHPFYTVKEGWHSISNDFTWVKAKDLDTRFHRALTPRLKHDIFEDDDVSYNRAFLLGLYLGDGTARLHYRDGEIKRSKYHIIDKTKQLDLITICLDKRHHDAYIKRFNQLGINYKYYDNPDTNNGYIDILDLDVINFLYKYGGLTHVGKYKMYSKFIHDDCMYWSPENKKALLMGFFWADGEFSMHGTHPQMMWANTNKQIIDRLYTMLLEFTNPCYTIFKRSYTNICDNPKDIYYIHLNGPIIKDLLNMEPLTTEIKWTTLHRRDMTFSKRTPKVQVGDYTTTKIYESLEGEEKIVYNISVEGDDSYLVTTNCYAVHNCKHLIATVYNIYNNRKMQEDISKDIDNYLRMLAGLDYDDYQQLNHAKQIQQQNRSVKWKNKPSDFMNEYFARQAKSHEFLDDHDIKKSLKKEMNKFIHANPYGSVDDFLRDYFQMTKKAFADDMKVPEDSIDDYFNELGFEEKTHKWQEKREAKNNPPTVEAAPEVMKDTGEEDTTSDEVLPERNSILDKDSEQDNGTIIQEADYGYGLTTAQLKERILKLNPHANVDKPHNQLYHIYNNMMKKQKSKTNNPKEDEPKFKYNSNGEASIRTDSGQYVKVDKDYFESEEVTEYFTKAEAHQKYQEYLTGHIGNVQEALKLIINITNDSDNPVAKFIQENKETLINGCKDHDKTKYDEVEYYPYLRHFYPTCKEDTQRTEEFEQACRHHIRNNKHHWDFWLNEETGELDINDEFDYKIHTIERVCDWLSMAKQHDEGKRDWYDANKDSIQQPDYGWEITDYLFDIIPDDYYLNLSFGGTRGKLDENEEGTK